MGACVGEAGRETVARSSSLFREKGGYRPLPIADEARFIATRGGRRLEIAGPVRHGRACPGHDEKRKVDDAVRPAMANTMNLSSDAAPLSHLLCGGDKRSQGRDIARALEPAKEV
jgi:hypothetical protein